jgi:hypothetical protein
MARVHLHNLFSRFYTFRPALNIDTVEKASKIACVHESPTPSLFYMRLTDGPSDIFPSSAIHIQCPFVEPQEHGNANFPLSWICVSIMCDLKARPS